MACDQQYKGHTIRLAGRMTRLEVSGKYRVLIIEPTGGSFAEIVCLAFNGDEVLGQLQPNQPILVRGFGAGMQGIRPVLAPCLVEH